MRQPHRPLAFVVAASLAVGVGVPVTAQDEPGSVVVTTEVLGSLVDQLVGDAGDVTVVMPSGADPHNYEPSARDVEAMLNADVLVSNGLQLEEALVSVFESAEAEGVTWFRAADHVDVLEPDEDHDHEADDDDEADHDDHDHGSGDPHIWTNPTP